MKTEDILIMQDQSLAMGNEIKWLREENKMLARELGASLFSRDESYKKICELDKENFKLKGELRELSKEIAKLEDTHSLINEHKYKTSLDLAHRELANQDKTRTVLEQELNALVDQNASLKKELEQAYDTMAKDRLRLEKRIDVLKEQLDARRVVINYFVLDEFATEHRISYNKLCSAVDKAVKIRQEINYTGSSNGGS